VTGSRIALLEKPAIEIWARPLNKLRAATAPYVGGKPILELIFADSKKPVGFQIDDMSVEVEIEGHPLKLKLNVIDLAGWLNTLK
jgi:hypothetical protein